MTADQDYIQRKKHFQEILLKYIDGTENVEEDYQNIINYFSQEKDFKDNKEELKILFKMIIKISRHHYRSTNFFDKIEKIMMIFKEDIPKSFTNSELYNMFQRNNRLLLFLFEEEILEFSDFVLKSISKYENDFCYFLPEILKNDKNLHKELLKEKKKEVLELYENNPDEFYRLRKTGENDSYVCQLIRNDDVNNFDEYIKKNKIKLKSDYFLESRNPTKIEESIYETNSYLLQNHYTIDFIEYACFFGSVKIFKYLFMNNIKLHGMLWAPAIHGRNMEIIHILEQHGIQPIIGNCGLSDEYRYKECFEIAMKNFHNEIADYILQFYLQRNVNQPIPMQPNYQQPFFRQNFMPQNIVQNNVFQRNFLQPNLYRPNIFQPCFVPVNFVPQNFQQNNFRQNFVPQNIQQNNPQQNNVQNQSVSINDEISTESAIKYMNFTYFPKNIKSKICFNYLCSNNFLSLVIYVLENVDTKSLFYDSFLDTFDMKDLLFKVVEKENLEILGRLYDAQPFNPNMMICHERGIMHISEAMLHIAVKKDNIKMVQFLVSFDNININQIYWEDNFSSYDISQKNDEEEDEGDTFFDGDLDDYSCVTVKKTALHLAVENENKEIVAILLNHPKINVNILKLDLKYLYDKMHGTESTRKVYKTRFITTALLTAIENDNEDMIRLLFTNPTIDVNKKSKFDYRYEYHYHERKRRGKDENHNRTSCGHEFKTPLFYAIEKRKSIELIKLLLSHDGIDINLESTFIDDNEELLDFMKRMMDDDVSPTEVVDNSIKIKEITKTPLEMAYYRKNDEVSNLLLENKKIDVNYKSGGEQIFKNAVQNGDIDLIKSYLEIPGFHVKKALKGTLQIAIQNDKIDLVKFLLNLPEINVNDKLNGKTPLQVAADKENIEVVQLLLNRPEIKFDPNTTFSNISEKKMKIISLLFDAKEKEK